MLPEETSSGRRSWQKRAEQAAQTLIAALLLGSATGCATVYDEPYRPPVTYARPQARPVRIVQVLPGDTVAAVARRFNASEEAIIEVNGLRAPYRLRTGQSLVLPPSSVHVVSAGDTIASIARAYDISPGAIIAVNNLHAPDNLYPGQRLTIPYVAPHQVARVDRVRTASAESELRGGEDPRVAGARYYNSGLPRPKPGPTGVGGPEYSNARVASLDHGATYGTRPKPRAADAAIKASSRFIWPVRGQVISSFGRRSNGVHNDGINIAAEPGSAVKAADHGVVVYAGNELAGYGNLLLVRHSNGFVTAYAHNKELLVSKGDNVRQGQTIARVGSTGDVTRPQLHFEIRKGDRAVDPGRYLESRNASL